MPERPISVVVPTRDRAHLLKDCLRTVLASSRKQDECIVVDSASATNAVRDVSDALGVRYIRCPAPGTSRARNAGWRAARHDIIAFVDDDVRVDEGWATAISRAFDDPGVAFVTGSIGRPPDAGPGGPPLALMTGTRPARLDRSTTGLIGHSANLAVRRQALETLGGFDELLGPGVRFKAAEDLDLFDRLFAAGYVGRYEPGASGHHVSWRRIRDHVKLQGAYGYGIGARLAKLLKTDRSNALRAFGAAFVQGSLVLVRHLKDRDRAGIAARTLRLLGTAIGVAVGMFHPVRDGHFGGRKYHAEMDRSPQT